MCILIPVTLFNQSVTSLTRTIQDIIGQFCQLDWHKLNQMHMCFNLTFKHYPNLIFEF